MIIIVGLGNPGRKFQKTRHNLGFRILDEFLKKNKFPKFKFLKKFDSLISKGFLNKEKIILAKPQTFMNNSGKAVKKIFKNLDLKIKNLFVVHDEIDLPLGKIKISIDRGSAGHKGVQSIIDELGTKDFVRFRIGIKPVASIKYKVLSIRPEKFVLEKFSKKEEEVLKEVIKRTFQAFEVAIKEGVEKAMSKYNIMPIYE